MSPENTEKAVLAELKFRAYTSCGWGLIILFGTMGVILGRPQGLAVAVIASVMWVQMRIVREAIDSLRMLRALKSEAKKEKQDDSGDAGDR